MLLKSELAGWCLRALLLAGCGSYRLNTLESVDVSETKPSPVLLVVA